MKAARRTLVSSLLALLGGAATVAAAATGDVDAGYNAFQTAQEMVNIASHSWEWGTAAEALLELYNPELSVFATTPFPNGAVPKASPSTFALTYARQFINRNSQVLVDNSAVGDPASLGVSAILLGQSDGTYIGAASRQADYILNDAPRFSNGAISHRPDIAEIWADNMAMSFPFCTCHSLLSRSNLHDNGRANMTAQWRIWPFRTTLQVLCKLPLTKLACSAPS